jgi:hypothetical protein
MKDPYVFLRRWLEAHLEPVPPQAPEEAGPPSWAGAAANGSPGDSGPLP